MLRNAGYPGAIYPVNPRAAEVQGHPAFASIADLPEAPSLAVIAPNATLVPDAIEACAARGIRGVIVFSSGFAELGEAGEAAQARLREIAHRTGIRVRRDAARVAERAPAARIDGVLVAPMAGGGIELILGERRDPVFDPVVMAGFGGIFAEIVKDVAVRPAPVDVEEATATLRSLKAFPLLDGARSRPRADLAAAASAIAALSRFAVAHSDEVAEIEVNPLLVRADGRAPSRSMRSWCRIRRGTADDNPRAQLAACRSVRRRLPDGGARLAGTERAAAFPCGSRRLHGADGAGAEAMGSRAVSRRSRRYSGRPLIAGTGARWRSI